MIVLTCIHVLFHIIIYSYTKKKKKKQDTGPAHTISFKGKSVNHTRVFASVTGCIVTV